MTEIISYYGLPEISEDLDEKEYNHRSKYRRLYIRLIERCKSMTEEELSGYCEKHHILPKCLGGVKRKYNLVLMPVKYHIMAHIILHEAFPDDRGLAVAAFCMINGNGTLNRTESIELGKFSVRTLARIKEEYQLSVTGENHNGYGIPRPDKFKDIMSIRFHGEKNPMYGRTGDKSPNFGKHRSEEIKQKLAKANLGKPAGKKRSVAGPDGTIYESIREASRKTGHNRDYISKRVNNQLRTHKTDGWKYL